MHIGPATSKVRVGVVEPALGQPYLRTYTIETWVDNLLSLPRSYLTWVISDHSEKQDRSDLG